MFLIKMITSGLLVQNRGYNIFPSTRTRERTVAHPYVYGFDKATVNKTDFHNPTLKTPPSVNFSKIFGRGITASEKDFFLTHGKTMQEMAAASIKPGRLRGGKKRKLSAAENDSYKNLLTFEEWKTLLLPKDVAMEGVDLFGLEDERQRVEQMLRNRQMMLQKMKDIKPRDYIISETPSPSNQQESTSESNVEMQQGSVDDSMRSESTTAGILPRLHDLRFDEKNIPPPSPAPGKDFGLMTALASSPESMKSQSSFMSELSEAIKSNKLKKTVINEKPKSQDSSVHSRLMQGIKEFKNKSL